MKYTIPGLLLLCATYVSYGQEANNPPAANIIYKYVEQQARFNGDLSTWIGQRLQYPAQPKKDTVQGKVYVKFVVTDAGKVTNVSIQRSSGCTSLDAEALRVVMAMPDWVPAKNAGKPVACYFTLPINFVLEYPPARYSSCGFIRGYAAPIPS